MAQPQVVSYFDLRRSFRRFATSSALSSRSSIKCTTSASVHGLSARPAAIAGVVGLPCAREDREPRGAVLASVSPLQRLRRNPYSADNAERPRAKPGGARFRLLRMLARRSLQTCTQPLYVVVASSGR